MDLDQELKSTLQRRLADAPAGRANWHDIEARSQSRMVRRVVIGSIAAATLVILGNVYLASLLSPDAAAPTVWQPGKTTILHTSRLTRQTPTEAEIAWDGSNFLVASRSNLMNRAEAAFLVDEGLSRAKPLTDLATVADEVVADPSSGRAYFFGALGGGAIVQSGKRVADIEGMFESPTVDRSTTRLYAIQRTAFDRSVRLVMIDPLSRDVVTRSQALPGASSTELAAAGGRVYAVTTDSMTLTAFDGTTLAEIDSERLPAKPAGIATGAATNRVAVLSAGDAAAVRLYDGATLKQVAEIDVEFTPREIVFNADGRRLYVAGGEHLAVVDALTGRVIKSERVFDGLNTGSIRLAFDEKRQRLGVLLPYEGRGQVLIVGL